MGGWDAIAASVSGVNPAAYGSQGGPMFRPVGKASEQTDDSPITVPVIDLISLSQQRKLSDASSFDTLTAENGGKKVKEKDRSVSGFLRGKVSNFNSLSDRKVNVTMRQVTRREYFKRYAKDNRGGYVGTEDPAEDCILNEEDAARWRGPTNIQLSLPFSGVGFETGKETGASKMQSTSAVIRPSTVAGANTTAAETKHRLGFFKGFKGRDTEREVVR